ncbi:MAG: FKBP-type peptidyl-prolyl cis-trans isomerase [Bacteroidales bacterium]|nr:FKBP-type peptidyl-prolyl cis-trans isomerase [Bacteroidales bacterium]
MKKLLLFAAAAGLVGLAACTSGHGSKNNAGFDTLFTQNQTDSLIVAMAQTQGYRNNTKFDRALKQDSTLNKKEFLKGFKYVLNSDTATSFAYGMYTAFNLIGQFNQWQNSLGLDIDRTTFYNYFSRCFLADSVNEEVMNASQAEAQILFNKLRDAQQKYEKAKLEASDEAINNVITGKQYIDSLVKADPEVKMLEGGVAIKIENPGEGDRIVPKDRVKVYYTASTLNGRVFDRQDENNARPILISTRPEGLQEGLEQLGQGGKATIYVPGKKAYGVEQNRRFNLGPNEAVVYQVEVVEVNPQNKK